MTNTGLDSFDRTVQTAIEWLDEIGSEMGREDRNDSYQALRAVLHTLHDRLTVEEGANLSAQLPMILRGLFYEAWKPSSIPVKLRDRDAFIEYVIRKLGPAVNTIPPSDAIKAVFIVLENRITSGEIDDIKALMPEELQVLWPS